MPFSTRLILWCVFAIVIFVSFMLAVCVLAGPRSATPPSGILGQRWVMFLGAFAAGCAAQAGYLAAPFVLGRDGWPLTVALALMGPATLAVLMSVGTPLFFAITATRPDGASGWTTVASIIPGAAIGLTIYGLPPVLLLLHRPR